MNYLRTLMRYKAWVNELVFAAAAKLREGELTAPRKIIFGSLLRTRMGHANQPQTKQMDSPQRIAWIVVRRPPNQNR